MQYEQSYCSLAGLAAPLHPCQSLAGGCSSIEFVNPGLIVAGTISPGLIASWDTLIAAEDLLVSFVWIGCL